MRKIIATILLATFTATTALAGNPDKNPCIFEGYKWFPEKGICAKTLDDKLFKKETCTPGTKREFRERRHGRMVTVVRTCGYVH